MARLSEQQAREIVERTCREQGIPIHPVAPDLLAQIRVLLVEQAAQPGGATRAQPRSRRAGGGSQSPEGIQPIRANRADPWNGGKDRDVRQDCADDGALPVEVECRPLSA